MKRKTAIEWILDDYRLGKVFFMGQWSSARLLTKAYETERALRFGAKLLERWAFARGSEKTPQQTARLLARLRRLGVLPEVRRG